jgi:hypothetical protein
MRAMARKLVLPQHWRRRLKLGEMATAPRTVRSSASYSGIRFNGIDYSVEIPAVAALRDTPILKEIQIVIAGISSFKTLHTRRTGNVVGHISTL